MFGPDLFARGHRRSRPFSDGSRDLAAERTRVDDTPIRRVIGSLGAVLKHRLRTAMPMCGPSMPRPA